MRRRIKKCNIVEEERKTTTIKKKQMSRQRVRIRKMDHLETISREGENRNT